LKKAQKSVIITGADRGLGLSLCKQYLTRGYTVFGGKYLEEYTLLEDLHEKDNNLHVVPLDVNCRDSLADASINATRDTGSYAYKLSKAALHMFLQMVANRLTPGGYTYRVYDPMFSEVEPKASAEGAFNYFTRRRGTENDDPQRDDEKRLVFRDALGREHAW
jgi:NAD(P)-dependent dehydrogenase (short-subunit alcohol dehydrogenase family)